MSNLLEQASLVMIPSGYKEDVVYSEIPLNGAGDFTFTRASNGTRINSQGLVEVVPWNLLQYSEDFSNAIWPKSSLTFNSTVTAPNGTSTAQNYSTTAAYAYAIQTITVSSGEYYTASCYLKYTSGVGDISIGYADGPGVNYIRVTANLINGTIGSIDYGGNGANGTATITSVGNGWYRVTVSGTLIIGNAGLIVSNLFYGATTFSIWGAQLNIGSTAKPYFPTTDRLNVPRLTYQNGGGGCPSLLLEKQSTNHCKWSNDLTQSSAWVDQTSNTTITQITSGGPDGGSFTRLVSTGSGNMGRMVQAGSISNPNGATMSVYLKGSGTAGFGLFIGNGISQYTQITLTNTWTRYTVSVSGTGSTYQDWEIDCYGGSTIDVSFVQIEVSSYATSPIPTTSSSATRVAEACYKTGISSLIGQTEGTLFADIVRTTSTGSDSFWLNISDNSSNNWVFMGTDGLGGRFYLRASSTTIVDEYPSLSLGRHKLAIAYQSGSIVGYIDGTQVFTSSATYTIGSLTGINLGYSGASLGTPVNTPAQVNEVVLFPTRLTNAELASLTTL